MAGLCDWDWENESEDETDEKNEISTEIPGVEIDQPTWPEDSEQKVPVSRRPVYRIPDRQYVTA